MCGRGLEGRKGARSEARGRPNMASEDVLEDLPGDQPVDSPVHTEQSDTESSVGNCGQSRPQHGRLFFLFPSITMALLFSVGFLVHFLQKHLLSDSESLVSFHSCLLL